MPRRGIVFIKHPDWMFRLHRSRVFELLYRYHMQKNLVIDIFKQPKSYRIDAMYVAP